MTRNGAYPGFIAATVMVLLFAGCASFSNSPENATPSDSDVLFAPQDESVVPAATAVVATAQVMLLWHDRRLHCAIDDGFFPNTRPPSALRGKSFPINRAFPTRDRNNAIVLAVDHQRREVIDGDANFTSVPQEHVVEVRRPGYAVTLRPVMMGAAEAR